MDPFEKFQPQAVKAVTDDFAKNPLGRYLLVIPTGGGKTFTAIRSIGEMYTSNFLSRGEHKVVWVAHREELIRQAREDLAEFNKRFPKAKLSESIEIVFSMVSGAKTHISNPATRLVILDEAHHGPAPTFAEAVFSQKHAGILGLTATPSRHDGKPLDFERESFSIGFTDLIKLGVLLNPTIERIHGIKLQDFKDPESEEDLELLNSATRDAAIIQALDANQGRFRKVIVYVGTKKHARALHARMLESNLKAHFASIAWVLGAGENSRGEERETFFAREKSFERSILINVALLTEGYNDRTVNTVILAAPCRSKLQCMQMAGRAVRRDPDNPAKQAFILEVHDDLPNIRYRIDNRWLFSDISDRLEPAVEDLIYADLETQKSAFTEVEQRFRTNLASLLPAKWNPDQRLSLLLFKKYGPDGTYSNIPVLLSGENRLRICRAYNYLSDRILSLAQKEVNWASARTFGPIKDADIADESVFKAMFEAMCNQALVIANEPVAKFINEGYPWVQFIGFRYWQKESDIPEDLLEFIRPCCNFEAIVTAIRGREYSVDSYVIRIPLPLSGSIAKIVDRTDTDCLDATISSLCSGANLIGYSQLDHVNQILSATVLPIESKLHSGLILIARNNYEWKKEISS